MVRVSFRLRFKVTVRVGLGLALGLGLLNMSIYEKLSVISVCLGGAEVLSAGCCAGDPGSIPPLCVF